MIHSFGSKQSGVGATVGAKVGGLVGPSPVGAGVGNIVGGNVVGPWVGPLPVGTGVGDIVGGNVSGGWQISQILSKHSSIPFVSLKPMGWLLQGQPGSPWKHMFWRHVRHSFGSKQSAAVGAKVGGWVGGP